MGLPLRTALIAAAGTLGLAGCASDYGYGYGGVSVGYGTNGYCDPYYGCDYGPYGYGYGYGDPWYGWYGDYYYPGIGIYVFDGYGRRHRWNDDQRRYWEGRRHNYQGRDWNDRRWQRWDGYRDRQSGTPDRGNWNDSRGRSQYREDRSSAQPWNEHRGDRWQGQQGNRTWQRSESSGSTTTTTPTPNPGGTWTRGSRGGDGGHRRHGG